MLRKNVFALFMFLPVVAFGETAVTDDGKNSFFKELYLAGSVSLNNEAKKETDSYGLELGFKVSEYNFTEHIVASLKGGAYYKYSDVKLESEKNETKTFGVNFGRIDYNRWTKQGSTPYLILGIEKSETKKTISTGTETLEFKKVFVWGAGVELKVNDKVTLDVYHKIKLDKIANKKLFDETGVSLKWYFIKY